MYIFVKYKEIVCKERVSSVEKNLRSLKAKSDSTNQNTLIYQGDVSIVERKTR